MSVSILDRNKGIVTRWIDDVFNSKHFEVIDELKVSGYLDWTPLPSQRLDLPVSGLKESLPQFLSSLPDFRFTADHLIAESDFVACLGHWRARHTGEYMGVQPTHDVLGGTRIDIFRLAGDKMVEHWGCGNELAFLQMVGVLDPVAAPETAPASVAREFVEQVLDQRNLGAAVRLLDPCAIGHSAQVLVLLSLWTAFPDLRIVVEDVSAEGDTVSVTSAVTGTHQGRFMGVEPTSRTVTGTRVDTFRVTEGKIVESWHDFDAHDLVHQLTA